LLIGISLYRTLDDTQYADLPSAINDVQALRQFLLSSKLKYKEENIWILIDPSIEEINEAMNKFYRLAEKRCTSVESTFSMDIKENRFDPLNELRN
jgi:transcriptional regulatory protein LevR